MVPVPRSALVLFAVSLCATNSVAQKGVLNAHLDDGVVSWKAENQAAAQWSIEDSAGNLSSGSIEVTNSHPHPGNGLGVTQCLPLVPIPGTTYGFGARIKILPGQSNTGSAQVGTRFYDGSNCLGNVVGNQPRRESHVIGSWVELSKTGLTIPDGAYSVLFLAFPSKVEAGGNLVARFDDLYFRAVMPFVDGFETGDGSAWSTSVPAVITAVPYADASKISGISRVFCQSGHCPWLPSDQLHDGLDFSPTEDLVPFQASCAGEIKAVDLFENFGNGKYQVNVMLECDVDETHGVVYAFEPFSGDVSVGNQQVANIVVQPGDTVQPGDLIGNLVRWDLAAAHVHYGVFVRGPVGQVCPGPLFSGSVFHQLLNLIQTDHPDWSFCH